MFLVYSMQGTECPTDLGLRTVVRYVNRREPVPLNSDCGNPWAGLMPDAWASIMMPVTTGAI